MRYVPEYLVQVPSQDGKVDFYLLEPRMEAAFTKYNNNAGAVNPSPDSELAQAFSHWSYSATGQRLMVTDLQGCHTGQDFTLTDPAIHAPSNDLRFPATNFGSEGVDKFFASHKCGPTCTALGLTGAPGRTSAAGTASRRTAAGTARRHTHGTADSLSTVLESYLSLK